MNYDIFAEWGENKTIIQDIPDTYAKMKYLLTRDARDARTMYQGLVKNYKAGLWGVPEPSSKVLELLPRFSLFLRFNFVLATPYLSKDDDGFHICDNPVKKDKVSKAPIVPGSTWKGNMRWAAGRKLLEAEFSENVIVFEKRRAQIVKLFGNENKPQTAYFNNLTSENGVDLFQEFTQEWTNQDGIRKGRLCFYPTGFSNIWLEVINPHSRRTKAGTMPIYIESVPEGARGFFNLLYVPFDLMGKPENEVKAEVISDLEIIYESLYEMMITYGFSAKKSSGFGLVRNQIVGTCDMAGCPIFRESTNPKPDVQETGPFAKLATLKLGERNLQRVKDNVFSSFEELKALMDRIKKAVEKNG